VWSLLLAQLALVELHGPTGQAIYLNPHEVTSLREPQTQGHLAPGTRCLIYMSNRNFIAVREACGEVRQRMEER
jgi:hypothetical protein